MNDPDRKTLNCLTAAVLADMDQIFETLRSALREELFDGAPSTIMRDLCNYCILEILRADRNDNQAAAASIAYAVVNQMISELITEAAQGGERDMITKQEPIHSEDVHFVCVHLLENPHQPRHWFDAGSDTLCVLCDGCKAKCKPSLPVLSERDLKVLFDRLELICGTCLDEMRTDSCK